MATDTEPAPGVVSLAQQITTWCRVHPADRPLPEPPEYGDLTIERIDGKPRRRGGAPGLLAIATDLLNEADPRWLRFDDGTLTIDVPPAPLRYRALGPDGLGHVVVFERIPDGA